MNAHNEQHDPASAVVKQNLTTAAAQEAVVTYCGRRLTPEGTRECWGYLSEGVDDLPRGTKLYAAPVTAAPAEMSPEFTDTARAAIAWVLWHHQGTNSPVGQPLRFALGMGQYEPLADWRIAEAKRYAEWAGATTAKFHEARAITPAAPGIDLRQFRDAVVAWSDKAYEESHNPEHPTIQQADRLLALIDASPKGALNEQFGSAEGLDSPKGGIAPCAWTDDGEGNWDTACGERFILLEGSPTDNKMRHCPYCGSHISESAQAGDAEVQP